MKNISKIQEARHLYNCGFAIHALHPKSKRPKGLGWASGPKKTWEEFKDTFKPDDNLGVRTGSVSKIGKNKFLCCIDVDVNAPAYREEILSKYKEIRGKLKLPEVCSGSGNGSLHGYCVTSKAFKMITLYKCAGGEIVAYSENRQMVLPPSIHPDSGKKYYWKTAISDREDLPLMNFTQWETKETKPIESFGQSGADLEERLPEIDFKSVEWKSRVSEEVCTLIEEGFWNGSKIDRSNYLPLVAEKLLNAGFDRNAVLTILTDKRYEMGRCAFEHTGNTKSRIKAAKWVWKYTLKRAMFQHNWKCKLKRSGKDGDGAPKSFIENVVLILQNVVAPDVFRRDLFSHRDIYGVDTPWGGKADTLITDEDVSRIRLWLGRQFQFEPAKEIVGDAITNIAHENSFDPVKGWLDSLPEWDRVQRLDYWLRDHFEAEGDPEYLAQVFRKWMIAMVMRQYEPGAKFDWMPIFEGVQGVGKSSFGRLLVGDKYFLDWLPSLADKDSAQALQGMWAVEMGELATMRKNEVEVVKGYLTRTTDKFRPPYGKRVIESPRRTVFYGTTNRDKYLRDETGNRRFKPIKVGHLDFSAIKRDREQLFAEAKYLFDRSSKSGETLELTGKAKVFEVQIQNEKMVEDESTLMLEVLRRFISKKVDESSYEYINPKRLKMSDLFLDIGPLNHWKCDQRNIQFAAKALKALGYVKKKNNGNFVWRPGTRILNVGDGG